MRCKMLFLAAAALQLAACGKSDIVSEESVSSESAVQNNRTWSSMEEAVVFYEEALIQDLGDEMADIGLGGEFYERESWELLENSGDTIVLSLANVGYGGRNAVEFVKGEEFTTITFFKVDTPYPETPISKRTVRNADMVTVSEEVFSAHYGTVEEAFQYLRESEQFTDDVVLERSSHNVEEKYFELVVASKELKAQGGSGTIGIYHVYEDGVIFNIE